MNSISHLCNLLLSMLTIHRVTLIMHVLDPLGVVKTAQL